MAKRVFFSIHYKDTIDFRANVVRNHWVLKDGREEAGYFDASIREEAKKQSEIGLKSLINGALKNTSVTCALVGSETYARPWVRYEIIQSIYRGNHVFGVHINQIKGKDQLIKRNGPNPFDYLAFNYSADGTAVEVFEAEGRNWVSYKNLPSYKLKTLASEQRRGKLLTPSSLGCKIYCWSANDGYRNFSNWVG